MTDSFLKGPLAGKLFRFALPVAFTIICEQLVNATDVLILGKFVGADAMAAVGNDMPVISLLISLLVGLSLGSNVLLAQAIGGGNKAVARKILHTSLLFSVLIGGAFTLVGESITKPLLALLDIPTEVLGAATEYLRIFFVSLPFLSLYNFEAACFRAMGNSRAPLYALIVAALTNGVLDLGAGLLELGLTGVIWATVLAYAVDAAILLGMLRKQQEIPFSWKQLSLDRKNLKDIVEIGLPAGIQGMVFSISNLVIQAAINSLGAEVMAASSAAFVVEINIYAFVNGFGQAATTCIGQNFGAWQLRRCFLTTRKDLLVGGGTVLAISLGVVLLARPIMGIFSTDEAVIAYGMSRIYWVTSMQIINSVIEILSGSLRGYGFSLPPALVVLVAICGVRIIWVKTVFAAAPSFSVLLAGYPLSWLVTAILLAFVYRSLRRPIFRRYEERVREA
ncbi:MATE family efflux transporter [Acidaminococcus fermentans]